MAAADNRNKTGKKGPTLSEVTHSSKLIFKDVNPETDCRTAFARKLPYAGGRCNLTLSESTPQEVIDAELAKNIAVKDRISHGPEEECLPVFPLAYPKGQAPVCDMCSEKAKLCCVRCQSTYYCSWKHRKNDTLHSQLCDKIKLLTSPPAFSMNAEHRTRQDAQKLLVMEKLLEDLTMEGFVHLYKGNFNEAVGLLRQSEKYISRVYGEGNETAQHISIKTAKCEAEVAMGSLKAAEESLNHAMYHLSMKNDKNEPSNKSRKDKRPKEKSGLDYACAQVNKSLGLLKFAISNFKDAAFYFAESIYYVSEVTSPTDVRTCSGYLNLAKCLLCQQKEEEGFAMMLFCAELWEKFLTGAMKKMTAHAPTRFGNKVAERPVSVFIELEANLQLDILENVGIKRDKPDIKCKALLCKGIMSFINKKYSNARLYAHRALALENRSYPNNSDFVTTCKYLDKHAARNERFFNSSSQV